MSARTPRSLLVVFNRVGDLTLSTPLFRALARHGPLSLVTRPFGPALLGGQPYLEAVYPLDYPNRGRGRLGSLLLGGHRRALGRRLLAAGFERVLIYTAERGVIRHWLRELFPERVVEMPHVLADDEHVSALYRRAAEALDVANDYDPVPRWDIPQPARARAEALLAPLGQQVVGVQMGSQRTHTVWPLVPRPHLKALALEQWAALVTRLLESGEADAVACHGSPREASMVQALRAALPARLAARCHDFTGVGLELLPAVLARETALLTLDTGPAHLAAAVGCPVLVFFGPTDPRRYRPLGRGPVEIVLGSAPCQFCHGTRAYTECRDNICLNRLTPEQLWEGWRRLRRALDERGRSA